MNNNSSSALESILSNNFDIESAPEPAGREKKMLFGCGIYFSEVLTLIMLLSDVYKVISDAINVSDTAKSALLMLILIKGANRLADVRQHLDPLQSGLGSLPGLQSPPWTQSFDIHQANQGVPK